MQSSKEQQGEKKAVLSGQCKEIEENNRIGKTKDLFKKIRDISCKNGHNKGKKQYGPTRSRSIKKRQQDYTEKLYKKDLHDPDNHDGVIIHIESDILECKVKWALGSITMNKASGGDVTPVELFQIPNDDTFHVLNSMCQQIWKSQQCPQD